MSLIERDLREKVRRAVRARGWTSAVADDAADAAMTVFAEDLWSAKQLEGAVDVVRELRAIIVRPVGEMSAEEYAKRLIAAVARADALLGGQ